MTSEQIITNLGGPSEVARLCEVRVQAVYQWYGVHPRTGKPRGIPRARLMFLKAVKPEAFEAANDEEVRA